MGDDEHSDSEFYYHFGENELAPTRAKKTVLARKNLKVGKHER